MTDTEVAEKPFEKPADSSSVEREIRQFISDNFPLGGDGTELPGGASLLEAGVIDSVGVLELIEHLEGSYGFSVPDADVLPENLDSVDAISSYVARRLQAAGSDGPH